MYFCQIGLYILFFLIVISSQAAISVPFNALVADKSHPSQRGEPSLITFLFSIGDVLVMVIKVVLEMFVRRSSHVCA